MKRGIMWYGCHFLFVASAVFVGYVTLGVPTAARSGEENGNGNDNGVDCNVGCRVLHFCETPQNAGVHYNLGRAASVNANNPPNNWVPDDPQPNQRRFGKAIRVCPPVGVLPGQASQIVEAGPWNFVNAPTKCIDPDT